MKLAIKKICAGLAVILGVGTAALAQETVVTVVTKELSAPDGNSYEAFESITLTDGFHFAPSTEVPVFSAKGITRELEFIILGDHAKNFIVSETIRKKGITDLSQTEGLTKQDKTTAYRYIDGLGRPVQQVLKEGSPDGKDLVQPIVYDKFGRVARQYLPYVSTATDGAYKTGALSAQAGFYNDAANGIATDSNPFAESEFDDSPLHKINKQGAFGADWQLGSGHEVKAGERFNAASEVRVFTSSGSSGFYEANQLLVSELTDENGHKVINYVNKAGQLILEKKEVAATLKDTDGNKVQEDFLETYYVYNVAGQLSHIIPPKAVNKMETSGSWVLSQDMLDKYVHILTYDSKGRLAEKTIPGAGPVYYLYDQLNRLVLVQDAAQRASNKWLFTKFDSRNRPVMEGVYTYTGTKADLETSLATFYDSKLYYEEPLAAGAHFYTNRTFPTDNQEVLTVHYYDHYDININGTADFAYSSHGLGSLEPVPTQRTRGLQTALYTKIIGTSNWLKEAYFYDNKGRLVQTQKNNQLNLTSLADKLTLVYNFDGTIDRKKQYQVKAALTLENRYVYDHGGRITEVHQKIDATAERKLASYHYNKLGQLSKKNLYGASNNTLQAIDYRYNIRGWVTHINDSELAGGASGEPADVFGMELAYNTTDTQLANKEYFNGNIAAVKWQVKNGGSTGITEKQRSYTFDYDANNQLRKADFKANTGSGWTNQLGDYNVENMMYDHNGNMVSINRYAFNNVTGAKQLIDELELTYAGNQLISVNDASNSTLGFLAKNGAANAAGEGYEYNAAGSMVKDYYKELSITYNVVNKTASVRNFANNTESIVYEYDGMANRLSKQVNGGTKTHYIDQFVYEGTALKYFGMPEGRIVKEGSAYKYEFFITDHQGNVRVSFEEVSGQAQVVQENHMYPFGLNMPGLYNVRTNGNDRFYNAGAEWQNDFDGTPNYYSTFFREYDPALGRFHAIDPKAMKFASWSPYQYGFNDPMYWNDPLGAENDSGLKNPGFSKETMDLINSLWHETSSGSRSAWTNDGNGGGSFSVNFGEGWRSEGYMFYDGTYFGNVTLAISEPIVVSADRVTVPTWWGNAQAALDIYGNAQNGGDFPSVAEMTEEIYGPGGPVINTSPGPIMDLVGGAGAVKGGYTVYRAVAKNGKAYWGITKDIAKRARQHGERFADGLEPIYKNLSKNAARGLEQMKIDQFGLQNLDNIINSISKNNPKLMQYYRDAIKHLNGL